MVWGRDNNSNDGDSGLNPELESLDERSASDFRTAAGRGGIELTARGTSSGLVLRASGAVTAEELWAALRAFIQSRRSFVEGNQVAIEWVDCEPPAEIIRFVRDRVLADFDIDLLVRGLVPRRGGDAITDEPRVAVKGLTSEDGRASSRTVGSGVSRPEERGLFGGLESAVEMEPVATSALGGFERSGLKQIRSGEGGGFMDDEESSLVAGAALIGGSGLISGSGGVSGSSSGAWRSSGAKLGATPKVGWGAAVANWDDADARFVYGTLRSGQKIETEHSVLIFGDVNSGAEIVAGGDVVVLGSLRGVAHAGAYDETGGGRVIVALTLEPTQLRIGAVISRGNVATGSAAQANSSSGAGPEIARVEGQSIVVEPYQAKGAPSARAAGGSKG